MATTKLWKFKSRLDRLIDYAINGEKTENKQEKTKGTSNSMSADISGSAEGRIFKFIKS